MRSVNSIADSVTFSSYAGQTYKMRPRSIALRIGDAADRLAEPACWFAAGIALIVLAYLLTAPPIILAHVRQSGSASFPAVYGPVLMLIESNFGGPMVRYFNAVWGGPTTARRGMS